ncbi:MAG: phage virion morphogenesis protein [Treponema sp.]|nr:phage virion morphogenesis protein [Treponema sp.]
MGVKVVSRPPDYGKTLGAGLAPVMKKTAMYLQSSANRKINSGIKPANAPLTQAVKQGSQTLHDSGELTQSIAPHSGELWADASTNLKYAHIQQEGGTITPKKSGALYIPAGTKTRELMRTYGARTPRALINVMKADGYVFFKAGRVFFAYKKSTGKNGKRGKEFALFIISSSVKIPARPFLYIDEKDEEYIMKLIQQGVMNALKGKV